MNRYVRDLLAFSNSIACLFKKLAMLSSRQLNVENKS